MPITASAPARDRHDPLLEMVCATVARAGGRWTGTMSELHDRLTAEASDLDRAHIGANPATLGRRLAAIRLPLAARGILSDHRRNGEAGADRRVWTFEATAKRAKPRPVAKLPHRTDEETAAALRELEAAVERAVTEVCCAPAPVVATAAPADRAEVYSLVDPADLPQPGDGEARGWLVVLAALSAFALVAAVTLLVRG